MSALKALLEKPAEWLTGQREESEMVLSCRVRLARNIDKCPFTHMARPSVLREIGNEITNVLQKSPSLQEAFIINLEEISEPERMILMERHLISYDMVKNFRNRALVVQLGEKLSVMINEEDHLRLQSIESGLSIQQAYEIIDRLDNEIDERLLYAFSENLGYLTACTTNVGTGLRVSAMVHLPGLVLSNEIGNVIKSLSNVRFAVRGMHGEGSEAMGNFFQISNSITLGLSEEETVKNLETYVSNLLEFEKRAREDLLKEARSLLEDKICRAYGILKSARLVTSKEAMGLISEVRMGVGLGIINTVGIADLNELLIMIKPMHLQNLYGRTMGSRERDRARADYIRTRLG